jgi:hypothetical protein
MSEERDSTGPTVRLQARTLLASISDRPEALALLREIVDDPEFSKLAPPARGLARVALAELLSAQGDRAEAEALKRSARNDVEQAPPHSLKAAELRRRLGG